MRAQLSQLAPMFSLSLVKLLVCDVISLRPFSHDQRQAPCNIRWGAIVGDKS